ncbi:S-adenosyl-L-methionine-dependent methyltransferase [Glarea lozoyensis ATCC 20868]|uniref:S-adenosyl-L-methionine-dependent methyltransferase n=1 Tax=Glarea lozoyensis (strain ATCC 20868 / MF5171) TaxID=1116229 RepID=S3CWP9_GLAL2|nr:S-adenosyl-L-methionine-dependent methyltransferase [Glarea lozoyensis ATCC 20868]EPE30772.1 S-adenosyl-L-methionine-dependent methyltransferase [Glarea lozoyensis ATCC 20868]
MASDTVKTSNILEPPPNNLSDTYRGPRHDGEYRRLVSQHDMFKEIMHGKLVLAPINLSIPRLRVLDSATADGYWLVDLSHSTHPSAVLCGSDIAPQHFKENLPKNVNLFTHNMFDTWPEDCQDSFDLVHQRFVLPVCSDESSLDVIGKLHSCVKPGGWIQLHDADFDTIQEGLGHEAMELFRDVMRRSWAILGYNLSPGPKLAGWMEVVGVENLQEVVLEVLVGAAAETKEIGQRPIEVMLAALEGVEVNLGPIGRMWSGGGELSRTER